MEKFLNNLIPLGNTRPKDYSSIEDLLSGAFAPVAPSQKFVSHLSERLTNVTQPVVEPVKSHPNLPQQTILAILTILGGTLLLAASIRWLMQARNNLRSLRPLRRNIGLG
jgi:hypothetical protein